VNTPPCFTDNGDSRDPLRDRHPRNNHRDIFFVCVCRPPPPFPLWMTVPPSMAFFLRPSAPRNFEISKAVSLLFGRPLLFPPFPIEECAFNFYFPCFFSFLFLPFFHMGGLIETFPEQTDFVSIRTFAPPRLPPPSRPFVGLPLRKGQGSPVPPPLPRPGVNPSHDDY